MKLSTTIGGLSRNFGFDKTIKMMADAGFDAMDFEFKNGSVHCDEKAEDLSSFFIELRKKAEDSGLCFNQSHAPMHSSDEDDEKTRIMFERIVRSMKYSALLGVETIVVHPYQHLTYADPGAPEKLYELNVEFYNKLKPYCEEYGIKVAVENMWQYPSHPIIGHSTCSTAEEFIKYMDAIDPAWFVACFDIGHAEIVKQKPEDFIRKLGHDRLKTLHVHDVNGLTDTHTIPYFGMVDWDKVTEALKDINYSGDLTYEISYPLHNVPEELVPPMLSLMVSTGRYLIKKIK